MRFNQKLKILCRQIPVNGKELASRAGVSPATAGRWLSGSQFPRLDEAKKLAEIFNVPLDYLARDDLDRPLDQAGNEMSFEDLWILTTAKSLGFERAKRRLLEEPPAPAVEIEQPGGRPRVKGQEA